MKNKNWIQRSVKKKGRVREYVSRMIGPSGFTANDTLKVDALKRAKKIAKSHHNRSMEDAITLALRLKKMKRKK